MNNSWVYLFSSLHAHYVLLFLRNSITTSLQPKTKLLTDFRLKLPMEAKDNCINQAKYFLFYPVSLANDAHGISLIIIIIK